MHCMLTRDKNGSQQSNVSAGTLVRNSRRQSQHTSAGQSANKKLTMNSAVTDLGQENKNRIKWNAVDGLTPRQLVLHWTMH